MIPPTATDLAEQNTVTETLDDLEQILQSVNIPTVHTMVEISQQQIPLAVAQSNLDSPVDESDFEVAEILSMPLIESVVEDQTSETLTNTEQNIEPVKPLTTNKSRQRHSKSS